MKVISTWTTILGILLVLIVGCGSTDNPIGEETPEPPAEPPTQIVSPILGDWRLLDIISFKDGVETNRIDSKVGTSFILTFAPDGIFDVVIRIPIANVTSLHLLEWLELEHIQEIVVTHRGKFYIVENRLRLNLIATSVKPKEAPKIDSDFEKPIFWYDFGNPGGPLDFIHSDDGNHLELRREDGEYMVKFIHQRPKTH